MAYAFNDDKSKYDLGNIVNDALPQSVKIALPLQDAYGNRNNSYYYKIGHTVVVGLFVDLANRNSFYENCFLLPEGYRPEYNINFGAMDGNSNNVTSNYAKIKTDGYIDVMTSVTEDPGPQIHYPLGMVCMFDVFESA